MLKKILEAHDHVLPNNVQVVFANTGKEMPQTYDFVKNCEVKWNVKIHWLEFYEICERGISQHLQAEIGNLNIELQIMKTVQEMVSHSNY